ncbi:MAG: hypothetical protein GX614_06345 [Sandaracinaceae bacterium]|nr:hypothetical protein [Sandaracinaceae bacterium]
MDKLQLVETLRGLLRDNMDARFAGGAYAKLARAEGYADGFMAALIDAGIFDERELLSIVTEERRRYIGLSDEDSAIHVA